MILNGMVNEIIFRIESGVGILIINRPNARNALNLAAQEQFASAIDAATKDETLRILIITGAGDKAFASGGDIKELMGKDTQKDALRLIQVMSDASKKLTKLPCPVIAAVNGDAIGGGCEILTACDIRLASTRARFRFAQASLGLTTGWGGAERLVRLIGLSQATRLLLTAHSIDAKEAYRIGFIHSLAENSVMEKARRLANELKALPQDALRNMKDLLWAVGRYDSTELSAIESKLFLSLWHSPDHHEAMVAFLEKRPPKFGQNSE